MIGRIGSVLGLMALAVVPAAAHAQAAPSPEALGLAAKFGARESIEAFSLSPDGNLLALVMPDGIGQKVLIYNFVTGGALRPILANPHAAEHIASCRWPTSSRLLCSIVVHSDDNGTLITFTRGASGDFRLVLWWLRRAAIGCHRTGAVQGDCRGGAGDRSAASTR
jgi:hypothetical protein